MELWEHVMYFLDMNAGLSGSLLIHYQHVLFREDISRQAISAK